MLMIFSSFCIYNYRSPYLFLKVLWLLPITIILFTIDKFRSELLEITRVNVDSDLGMSIETTPSPTDNVYQHAYL